jgi:formate hydrogenlyase subunit 3/multisubunit Na+/H+ antiporter MnhD subunit
MDPAHLHLLINHIPVLGTVFGILLLLYGMLAQKHEVTRASLGLFVLVGLGAVVAYLSGEGAEDTVEGLPGVAESIIETHEEAALIALIAAIVLGVAALLGLVVLRKQTPRWAAVTTLVLALGTAGVMAWTANLGGQVRHTELRDEASTTAVQQDAPSETARDDYTEERDDD